MNHSSTLEFSSRPPVSVYSTGRAKINDSAFSRQYGSRRLSPRPKVRGTLGFAVAGRICLASLATPFNVLFRQHARLHSCVRASLLVRVPEC